MVSHNVHLVSVVFRAFRYASRTRTFLVLVLYIYWVHYSLEYALYVSYALLPMQNKVCLYTYVWSRDTISVL